MKASLFFREFDDMIIKKRRNYGIRTYNMTLTLWTSFKCSGIWEVTFFPFLPASHLKTMIIELINFVSSWLCNWMVDWFTWNLNCTGCFEKNIYAFVLNLMGLTKAERLVCRIFYYECANALCIIPSSDWTHIPFKGLRRSYHRPIAP